MQITLARCAEKWNGRRIATIWLAMLAVFLLLAAAAMAEDSCKPKPAPPPLPTPYSGDFLSRSTLTGDWGGLRNTLAAKGVTLDLTVTQTEQGVVGGGKSSSWEYGGRGQLTLRVDTGKLGLWPGGFLTMEAEGNFGHAVNPYTGALMPVNENQIYPVPGRDDIYFPAWNFAQFLSEYFGIVVGKLDTTGGDDNEFAHGKGDTQFMNLAFGINPVAVVTVPYSTLGAGVIVLPTKDPNSAMIQFNVLNSAGVANTAGFDELNGNKLTFTGLARVRTGFFGFTGHQSIGLTYSNKEFTSIDQRLGQVIVTNQIEKKKGSWAVFYNFDQYLFEPEKGSGRGIGIFGRFGASDGNPNPMKFFYSAGVGGKGFLSSRPNDSFGLGYYYMQVENLKVTGPLATRSFLRNEYGFEAFYTVAVTPWMLLTPDIQVVRPAQKEQGGLLPFMRTSVDTATILGLRMRLIF
jgi:porin